MDLPLYGRVLWRHRLVLLVGVILAVVLAVLAYYRVTVDDGVPKLTPREAEVWQSQASVFLTEAGFPAGRRTIDLVPKRIGGELVTVPKFNDPTRFAAYASLYARLATSDIVLRRMRAEGPLRGVFQATPVLDSSRRETEPIVSVIGSASNPRDAIQTVERGLNAFLWYIRSRQLGAKIPASDRIQLSVVNQPRPAVLVAPRKRTLPVVVFLAVMIAAIASVFVLENMLRSRSSRVPVDVGPEPEVLHEADGDEPESEPSLTAVHRWG